MKVLLTGGTPYKKEWEMWKDSILHPNWTVNLVHRSFDWRSWVVKVGEYRWRISSLFAWPHIQLFEFWFRLATAPDRLCPSAMRDTWDAKNGVSARLNRADERARRMTLMANWLRVSRHRKKLWEKSQGLPLMFLPTSGVSLLNIRQSKSYMVSNMVIGS
jgi:hypothetical protein